VLHKMGQQSDPKERASLLLSEELLKGFMEAAALTEPSHTHTHTQRHGTIERSGDRVLPHTWHCSRQCRNSKKHNLSFNSAGGKFLQENRHVLGRDTKTKKAPMFTVY